MLPLPPGISPQIFDHSVHSIVTTPKLINGRGKKLEEFLISKLLYIMNEESKMKTFQSSRGSSLLLLMWCLQLKCSRFVPAPAAAAAGTL